MKFYFARLKEDGRLQPIQPGYETRDAAAANATSLLSLRQAKQLVLIEVIERIEITAKVKFEKWKEGA